MDYPVRLLLGGYTIAGLAALAIAATGGGVVLPLLTFWLGGAGVVLVLPTVPVLGRAFRRDASSAPRESANLALEEELRRWEEDRAADTRAAQAAMAADTAAATAAHMASA